MAAPQEDIDQSKVLEYLEHPHLIFVDSKDRHPSRNDMLKYKHMTEVNKEKIVKRDKEIIKKDNINISNPSLEEVTVVESSDIKCESKSLVSIVPTDKELTCINTHFTDIEAAICQYIENSDWVHMAAAWLTSPAIIMALGNANNKVIIGYTSTLIPGTPAFDRDLLLSLLSNGLNIYMYKSLPFKAHIGLSSMFHHKFIVFGTYSSVGTLIPTSVWTGSYNFTISAKTNIENGIHIEDKVTANEYEYQFRQLLNNSKILTL